MSSVEHKVESEIILACAQTTVDTEKLREMFANLDRPLDWSYIFKIAGRNGLLPLVGSNLLEKVPEYLDNDIRKALAEFRLEHTRNNFLQTTRLIDICEMLEGNGIPVLPVKGPMLSMQAYGDLSLRQFVDLDILVQPKHFGKAVELLQSCGYTPIERVSWLRRKSLFFTRKKDVGLVSEDGNVHIELHWKLSGTHFAMPFEIDGLWQRIERRQIAGADLRALPFDDLFVYLCLHGSRHNWANLLWICDINELALQAERSSSFDWLGVRQHARIHGCEKAFELGLFLINYFFGQKVGFPELDRVLRRPVFQEIADKVRDSVFGSLNGLKEMSDWYSYHLSLKEKKLDRLRIHLVYLIWYVNVATKPNELDEAVFKLPALFYPLYYLIRPIRLAFTKR